MPRSSIALLTLLVAVAATTAVALSNVATSPREGRPVSTAANARAQDGPIPRAALVEEGCIVDAMYPLRIVLSDDPAGFTSAASGEFAIRYDIVAAHQFESVEVELISSPGTQILSGQGALERETLGVLRKGDSLPGQISARVLDGTSPGTNAAKNTSVGTVQIRVTGWSEGRPLETTAVWNLFSRQGGTRSESRTGITAQGDRVVEHQARKVSR